MTDITILDRIGEVPMFAKLFLVTTTPTNVIPFNAGYFSIKDMAKVGLVLTVGASLVIAVVFVSISGIKGGF